MSQRKPTPAEEFKNALDAHAPRYGVPLSERVIEQLTSYFEIVMAWNTRLHLVAPCAPAEFATRHVLESMFALPFISEAASVADVGSGAGLPVIPCLIARPDIHATLIEANAKKVVFLREALRQILPRNHARVIGGRFEHTVIPEVDYITCRALDRFTEKLGELATWSTPASVLLFFGGPTLREQIEKIGLSYTAALIPESEQRFLFIIKRAATAQGQT